MITPDELTGWVGLFKNPSIIAVAGVCIYYLYRELNYVKEKNDKLHEENERLHAKIEEILKEK